MTFRNFYILQFPVFLKHVIFLNFLSSVANNTLSRTVGVLMGIFRWIKFSLQGESFQSVLAMIIFLFRLLDFSFQTARLFVFFAGIVQQICWSGPLDQIVSSNSVDCFSELMFFILCLPFDYILRFA